MARKKTTKQRGSTKKRGAKGRGPGVWVTLAIVLLAVGFACSRQNRATHVREPAATAAPESTPAAVPVATAPPATEAPATPEPLPTESPSSEPSATPSAPAAAEHQNAGGPKLAIIIDDCGQWPTTERGFIALPIALTLSVLPDVRFNHTIEKEAADAGKGVMLHIPMETVSGMNPGPGKITTEMTDDAIKAQVAHDLADVDLAQGANNHEGSKATSDHRTMEAVMSALAADHRFFIDSKTIGSSVAESVAREHGMLAAARDVFLDNKADVAYTEGQLREAVAIAKRDGSAIAIGHPRPTTLAALTALYPEFQAEGVDFVLAGTLVK